jgi:hypothetical protein
MSAQIQEQAPVAEMVTEDVDDFEVLDIDDPMMIVKHNVNVC